MRERDGPLLARSRTKFERRGSSHGNGNFLIYIGQPKQAIDQVKEPIRLNPNHENWYVEYLGWAYEEAGMPMEAIEIFEQAIDLQNPNEDQLWYLPTYSGRLRQPYGWADGRRAQDSQDAPVT